MATMEEQQIEAIRELQKINNLNMFAMQHNIPRSEAAAILDVMGAAEDRRVPYPPPPSTLPGYRPDTEQYHDVEDGEDVPEDLPEGTIVRRVGNALASASSTALSVAGSAASTASNLGRASTDAISALARRAAGTAAALYAGDPQLPRRREPEYYQLTPPAPEWEGGSSADELMRMLDEEYEFQRIEQEQQRRAQNVLALRKDLGQLAFSRPSCSGLSRMESSVINARAQKTRSNEHYIY